jgi:hypothetical protein
MEPQCQVGRSHNICGGAWHGQGDQIGRIFAYLAVVYVARFFFNYKISAKFWPASFHGASYVFILTKKGWDAIWAIPSQTNLVALIGAAKQEGRKERKKVKSEFLFSGRCLEPACIARARARAPSYR